MSVCAPLRTVGTSGTSGDTSALKIPGSTNQQYQSTWNPVNGMGLNNAATPAIVASPWLNPVWELIASAFVRYRILRMVYEYLPQSAATLSDQLVFAFANDPLHPVIGLNNGASEFTNQVLLGLADSIPFMPWREWSLDVTSAFSQDQPFYVARNFTGSSLSDYVTTRFSDAGIFAMTCSGTAASAAVYGVLYGKIDIELLEFCPILPYNLATLTNTPKTIPFEASEVCKSHVDHEDESEDRFVFCGVDHSDTEQDAGRTLPPAPVANLMGADRHESLRRGQILPSVIVTRK